MCYILHKGRGRGRKIANNGEQTLLLRLSTLCCRNLRARCLSPFPPSLSFPIIILSRAAEAIGFGLLAKQTALRTYNPPPYGKGTVPRTLFKISPPLYWVLFYVTPPLSSAHTYTLAAFRVLTLLITTNAVAAVASDR